MNPVAFTVTAIYDILGAGLFMAGRLAGNFARGFDGCYVPIATNPEFRKVYKEAEVEIKKELKKELNKRSKSGGCGFTANLD